MKRTRDGVPVKSRWIVGALCLGALALSGDVSADEDASAEDQPPPTHEPYHWPGPWIELHERPVGSAAWPSVCSFRLALCVHSAAPAPLRESLADAERAWDTATLSLGLPAPLPARDTGAFDIYLQSGPDVVEQTVAFERDPRGGLDRATAFSIVDGRLRGCALEASLTRQVLAASAFRVAPSMDRASREGGASALARLMTPCALASDTASIGAAQSHPELTVVDERGPSGPRAASLLFGWLDDAFAQTPGATIVASWALSPTKTPRDAARWDGKPTVFDVLRESFKGALFERSTLEDLLIDFGVARAFVGSSADATHFLESRSFGDAGKVALAWDVPWPDKPRRLVAPIAVQPLGSSFVRISRAGAPKGSQLRIEADWETMMTLRWVAVKLDAAGHELARIPVASPGKATHGALSLGDLDATANVLLVATNVGEWSEPFEPTQSWEPHGYMVTIASE